MGGPAAFSGYPTAPDANSGGTVTSVGGTAPIVSTGGAAPVISITPATTSDPGSMSAADKTKLDGIAAGATATPLSNATPQNVGTAAAGISTSASRADHVHALANTAVAAGPYPTAGQIPTFTVGADGRLTAAGSATSGSGLTALNATNISSGTLAAARMETVGPGAVTTAYPSSITQDAQGRIIAIAAGTAPAAPVIRIGGDCDVDGVAADTAYAGPGFPSINGATFDALRFPGCLLQAATTITTVRSSLHVPVPAFETITVSILVSSDRGATYSTTTVVGLPAGSQGALTTLGMALSLNAGDIVIGTIQYSGTTYQSAFELNLS